VLANAYTVLNSSADDLTGDSQHLWVTPAAPLAGEPAQIGLLVTRVGGAGTLADVPVRFYESVPGQPGLKIGDTRVPFLSPNSSAATAPLSWTPASSGARTLYAIIDPDKTLRESNEMDNLVSRLLMVRAASGDRVPPVVDAFSINHGEAQTDSTAAVLNLSASDPAGGAGVAKVDYLEFEYSPAIGVWAPIHRSGWLNAADASVETPWDLLPTPGFHVVQAWAADAAGNISLRPGQQGINYLPSHDTLEKDQARVYRFKLDSGDGLTATLTPTSGDADLYVWPPDHASSGRSPWVSNNISANDQVSFTAPVTGWYQVEVHAATSCAFQLGVAVTPNAGIGGGDDFLLSTQGGGKAILTTPAIPLESSPDVEVSLDPLEPAARTFLPAIVHP
jgi:hypothetical protein